MSYGDPILLEIIPPKAHPHNASATYLFQCTYCSVEFSKSEGRAGREGNQFCSRRCRWDYQKKYSVGSWVCKKRGVYKNCETCSKEFHVNNFRKNQARFCSYECYWQTLVGKSVSHGYKFTSENIRGSLNPAWRGGISFEPYGKEFFEIRDWIRQRDQYQCQVCDGLASNGGHSVHHIDYDKMNNCEENLVTVCKRCHGETNSERKYWVAFFEHLGEMKARWQLGR